VGGNLFWNGVTLNTLSGGGSSQWTTTVSASIYYSSGNVGIGTNSPISNLEIRKDAASALGPILSLTNYPGGGGAGAAIDFYTYVLGPDQPEIRILAYDNNYSADLIFYSKIPGAAANPLVERMRILNNGNVGIGNSGPSNLFQVSNNSLVVSSNGHVGVGTSIPQSVLSVGGDMSLSTSTLSFSSGNNNDVTIADAVIYIASKTGGGGGPTVTGLTGGVNGRIIYLIWTGTQNLTLANQSANSTAANRIIVDGTAATTGAGSFVLIYDGNVSRWRVVSLYL
jgi:hypothetical protein